MQALAGSPTAASNGNGNGNGAAKAQQKQQGAGFAGFRGRMRGMGLTRSTSVEAGAAAQSHVGHAYHLLPSSGLHSIITLAKNNRTAPSQQVSCVLVQMPVPSANCVSCNALHLVPLSVMRGLQTCAHFAQEAGQAQPRTQAEREALVQQRDALAAQLRTVADKIARGVIPDAAELAVPDGPSAAAVTDAPAATAVRGASYLPLQLPMRCTHCSLTVCSACSQTFVWLWQQDPT